MGIHEEIEKMNMIRDRVKYSYESCKYLMTKNKKTEEDLEKIEAATLRVERFKNSLVKVMSEIYKEEGNDLIERGIIFEYCDEKIVTNQKIVEVMIKAEDIRNENLHEKQDWEIEKMQTDAHELIPKLLGIANDINEYCKKYI